MNTPTTGSSGAMARRYLIAALLVLLTAAAFSEVPRMTFVDWDDHANVCYSPYLNPVTLDRALHFWQHAYLGFYIPVTRTVWAALAYFARVPPNQMDVALNPTHFHVANLVVHVLNVLLVFAIVRLLVRSDWPAAAGAALFALHPVQVEPVAWITGMKDLLGGLLGLATLWQYLLYAVQSRDNPQARWRRAHYALAMVAFALAVLSKQTVVVVPLMAWALDRWVLGRPLRDCTWALAGWVPIALGAAAVAKLTSGPVAAAPPIWARLFVAGDRLAFYLSKLVAPVRLGCHYARKPDLVLGNWWGYATWLLPAALAAALWLARRRAPILLVAFGVFVVGVLPVLGLVPFGNPDVCDRFMYLAMLGPALALAWALSRTHSKLAGVICALGLVTLGVLSSFQSLVWHNTLILFTHALEVNPRSAVAHNALGTAMITRSRVREGYVHYQTALRLDPGLANAHENVGLYFFYLGKPDQAIEHYREALRLDPARADTHYNLGIALAMLHREDEAVAEYREALRLRPEAWNAHNNLAVMLHAQGSYAEAEEHYRETIDIKPDYAEAHYNLGRLYADMGRAEQARQAMARALRLKPELARAPLPGQEVAPESAAPSLGGRPFTPDDGLQE